jgi:hypothetical protein
MPRSTGDLANVFRRYGEAYRADPAIVCGPTQQRVMRAIERCRTAALGGHRERCDACGHERMAYNSCRNRHCPKCQGGARAAWVARRQADLLDTQYFHVVFTVPEAIAAMAFQNKTLVYGLLLRAAADTLRSIAADPRHLGAEIGGLTVLHTWSQTLIHHPHVHCLVPGGGLSPDHTRWVSCRPGFFLPVRVLSRRFRRLVLAALQAAFDAGLIHCRGTLEELSERPAWSRMLAEAAATEWVVYAKAPCAGPQQVLEYLGRYTHRVALSNDRLLAIDGGQVTFSYRAPRATAAPRRKTMTLPAAEFIRRFLLHVLPSGFHRIRAFGFLANRHRRAALARCRQLLGAADTPVPTGAVSDPSDATAAHRFLNATAVCPACQRGRLVIVAYLPPDRSTPVILDTS